MNPANNDQSVLNLSPSPFENTPIIPPPLSETSEINTLISGGRRGPNKRHWTGTTIIKIAMLGVLVVGLFFGLLLAQTNQEIRKQASYCGMCSPNGDCECVNGNQTGNKCKYAPPECSNLGNTWQPDSSCTANTACGNGDGNERPAPTSINERPVPPTPTPPGGRGKNQNPRPTPTSAHERPKPER